MRWLFILTAASIPILSAAAVDSGFKGAGWYIIDGWNFELWDGPYGDQDACQADIGRVANEANINQDMSGFFCRYYRSAPASK